MELVFIVCLYLIIGCSIVFWKTKEIESLVGIICVHNNIKPNSYYVYLILAKIILAVFFPIALLLK